MKKTLDWNCQSTVLGLTNLRVLSGLVDDLTSRLTFTLALEDGERQVVDICHHHIKQVADYP